MNTSDKILIKEICLNNDTQLPLVSIIILSYNNSKYIRECLDSCIKQSYPKIEIIVIDDGSKDNSTSIIEEIFNSTEVNITAIFSSQNSGIVKSYNRALDYCKGDYIAHIGSDDFNFLNRISSSIELLTSSDASMVVGGVALIDENNRIIKYGWPKAENQNLKFVLKNGISVTSPTMFYSNELIIKFGKLPINLANEDEELAFRAIIQKGIIISPEVLVAYRKHIASLTNYSRSIRKLLSKFVENSPFVRANYYSWEKHLSELKINVSNGDNKLQLLIKKSRKGEKLYSLLKISGLYGQNESVKLDFTILLEIFWLLGLVVKMRGSKLRNKVFALIKNKKISY
jgi:alpha-1,3-rhamnosyltransferase